MEESKIFAVFSIQGIMFGWWPVELIKNDRFRIIYKLYKQLLNTITYCFLFTFFLGLVITVLNDATMKDVFENASVFLGLTVAAVRAWIANSKRAYYEGNSQFRERTIWTAV